MYKAIVLIFALFSINTCLKAQTSIDFHPKMLDKELGKTDGGNNVLNELPTSPDVSCQIYLGKFYSVSHNSQTSAIKYVYIGRVKTCRAGGCSMNNASQNGEQASEFFDYFMLLDSACIVRNVKIYNYQATHGQEVTAKSWLKQFIGYNGDRQLVVGKNVDAISGATISVDAAAIDIEHKTGLLKQAINKL
jgi:hypothetical protein